MTYRYFSCAVISIALLLTSCKKLVDIDEPIDTVTSAKIFSSDEQANQTLAGMYSQMVSSDGTLSMLNGGATMYGGLAADELSLSNGVLFAEEQEINSNKILVNNSVSESVLWMQTYKTVYTANAILDGEAASTAVTLTKAKRIELKASARFFRAFSFFYLTNFFGDIPLPLSSDYRKTIRLKRASQLEVYEQIIADLKEAISLFSDPDAPVMSKTKANKVAAQALLARAYLYIKDWDNAENYANQVIANSVYQLEPLKNTFDLNSKETVLQFTINPSTYIGKTNEMTHFLPLFPLSLLPVADQELFLDPDNYESFLPALTPRIIVPEQLANAFEAGDQRKTAWLDYNPSPVAAPYFGRKTYFANKYPNSETDKTNYVLIRLAELHLIRAEARAMLNKNNLAAEDIDLIRNKAGLGKTTAVNQESLLTAVAQERKVELFAEWGHRFLDLKRTGKALSVLSAIPGKEGITADDLLFPIPPLEILANSNLTQNPGY